MEVVHAHAETHWNMERDCPSLLKMIVATN